jgi:hypothetical protein
MNFRNGEGSGHRIIEAHLGNMPEGPGRNSRWSVYNPKI